MHAKDKKLRGKYRHESRSKQFTITCTSKKQRNVAEPQDDKGIKDNNVPVTCDIKMNWYVLSAEYMDNKKTWNRKGWNRKGGTKLLHFYPTQ